MKRICILSTNENVLEAREIAKAITEFEVLNTPASESGKLPATHWFCFMSTTEEGYAQILELQKNSVMEESSPKSFLQKWKLKIIK